MESNRREGKGKWIARAVPGSSLSIGRYYLFSENRRKSLSSYRIVEKETGLPPAPSRLPEPAKEPLPAARPSLADSDDWVRKKGRSCHPKRMGQWLTNKNLIRSLTAAW